MQRTHLRTLRLLKRAFAGPLREASRAPSSLQPTPFSEERIDTIFGTAMKLIPFHMMLLRDLERT